MPRYLFICDRCGTSTEVQRKVDERDTDPPVCVECHSPMKRGVTAPQGNFPGAGSWRGGK